MGPFLLGAENDVPPLDHPGGEPRGQRGVRGHGPVLGYRDLPLVEPARPARGAEERAVLPLRALDPALPELRWARPRRAPCALRLAGHTQPALELLVRDGLQQDAGAG